MLRKFAVGARVRLLRSSVFFRDNRFDYGDRATVVGYAGRTFGPAYHIRFDNFNYSSSTEHHFSIGECMALAENGIERAIKRLK